MRRPFLDLQLLARRQALPALALLTACGPPDDVPIEIFEGVWVLELEGGGADDGDCGASSPLVDRDGTAPFTLARASSTVLELTPEEGEGAGWGCLSSEPEELPGEPLPFTCGTWTRRVDWDEELSEVEEEPDATVRFEHDLEGSFTSDTEASVALGFTILCDGTGCEDAGELLGFEVPCAQEQDASLRASTRASGD